MIEMNRIYAESALDTMSRIPDNSVDLIVTDCPYKIVAGGITVDSNGFFVADRGSPTGDLDRYQPAYNCETTEETFV